MADCCGTDNLVVQWGLQDNYEIVRKVGRGKYSEVSRLLSPLFPSVSHSRALLECSPSGIFSFLQYFSSLQQFGQIIGGFAK